MDPQVRNFRDFLTLYNKLTELCFSQCTDNFYNRSLANDESNCIDKCVLKFSNVNQKIMGLYVEAQTAINNKRLAEINSQVEAANATAAAAAAAAATAAQSPIPPPSTDGITANAMPDNNELLPKT